MKINIVTGPNFPVPPLAGGAISKLWFSLAQEFSRQGHSTTILARAYDIQSAQEKINDVTVIRHGGFDQQASTLENLCCDLSYAWHTSRRIPPADITVINDFWLPAITPWLNPAAGKVVINAARYPKHQYALYSRCAAVVACSQVIADTINKQTPGLLDRVSVIHNPVDNIFLDSSRELPLGTPKKFLYVGRLHPEKGVHILLKSFRHIHAEFPDVSLTITGPHETGQGGGGKKYLKSLQSTAQDLPVVFSGPVFNPNQLVFTFCEHDLFIYPSLAEFGEAMPVAPLEAMACGLPPVVPNLKCFADYITNKTGFLYSASPDEGDQQARLTETLRDVLSSSSSFAERRSAAMETAKTFSAQRIATEFLELFTQLVKS
ncbi:MAG: glycosyltransferase family 4 protein [Verrucomicrobiota bacterium]